MAILDTCTFVWLVGAKRKLSNDACYIIEQADDIYLSAITITEIHRLFRRGELELSIGQEGILQWVNRGLEHHRITPYPVSCDVAHQAELLPWIHKDPADRFIVASALMLGVPVVSPDQLLQEYPVQVVW